MYTTIVIILLVLGIIFFLVELFLLPGISIAGVIGFLLIGGSVYCAYAFIGPLAGTLTLIGSLILFAIAVWWFMRSKMLDRMSLKTEIDGKVDPLNGLNINVGDKGKTVSRLAPMGKVMINGATIEAKTNDDFIDPGEAVIVLEVYNTNVLVKREETLN